MKMIFMSLIGVDLLGSEVDDPNRAAERRGHRVDD
jgi:hypothetical protein